MAVSEQRTFDAAALGFAFRLFTHCFSEDQNTLVSPVSVMMALGMVLNGAAGETEEELKQVLAGEMSADDFQEALTGYVSQLPSNDKEKFCFADSIWVEKAFRLNRKYEKETEKLYRAAVERLKFDESAVRKINDWVKKATDGQIDSVIDSATPEAMLYLINALSFDAEWAKIYSESDVSDVSFKNLFGTESEVPGLWSEEAIYLKAEGCTGFVKPYAGGRYSFVAFLPDDPENAADFFRNWTAERYLRILASRTATKVSAMIPKFSLNYSAVLNSILGELGIRKAFGAEADLSGISPDRIAIGEVIHKTHIEVDERGTKAGAVTAMMLKTLGMPEPMPEVHLDRPFAYAVADNERLIPLFLGTVVGL